MKDSIIEDVPKVSYVVTFYSSIVLILSEIIFIEAYGGIVFCRKQQLPSTKNRNKKS